MQGLADTAAAGDAAPNSSSDESESLEDEVSSQGRSADGSESISSLENRGYAYESASASSDDGFVSVCSDVDGAEAATVDAVTIGSTNAAAAEEVCEGEAVPQSAWQRQVECVRARGRLSAPSLAEALSAVFVYFTSAVVTSGALLLLRGIGTEDFFTAYHQC